MSRATQRQSQLPAALAFLLAVASAGCSQTFTPASVVEDRRVLALVAEPPELDATTAVQVTTVRAVEAQPLDEPALPAGTTLARRWTFCPFSVGASTGYACAVPQCEVPLLPDASGAVTVDPMALVTACLGAPGTVLPPDLAAGTFPARSDVLVRFQLVEVAPGGQETVLREAVQRIPVWNQPHTQDLNTLPRFDAAAAVTVGSGAAAQVAEPCADVTPGGLAGCPPAGTLSPAGGLAVTAAIDPDSVQQYPVGDRTAVETFVLSYFTTAGRFDFDSAVATRLQPTATVTLKHESVTAGTTDALLWVVLRDLRGGQAVAGPYRLLVVP